MPLKFKKSEATEAPAAAPSTKEGGDGGSAFPSWMKSGKDAEAALNEAQAQADAAAAERNKMFRFWLKPNTDATIVFLDGNLATSGAEEGKLDVHTFREHTTKHKSDWYNIVCAEENGESCPLCEADDNASLVAPFTVIDTRKIQGKKRTYENEPKLFIAKPRTIAQLQKIASKRGGLRGCVFEVSRSDDRSARVGDSFDFEGKMTEEQLIEEFGEEHVQPADYGKEVTLRSAEEIRSLLQGSVSGGGGSVGGEGIGGNTGDDDIPF